MRVRLAWGRPRSLLLAAVAMALLLLLARRAQAARVAIPSSTSTSSSSTARSLGFLAPTYGARHPHGLTASSRSGHRYRTHGAATGDGVGEGDGDRMRLLDEVERALKGPCGVAAGGSPVVVAVSGGADSVALLHLLAGVRCRWQPPLRLAVAHFNHGLRPEASVEEEAFVRELAASLDVPVHVAAWAESERAKPAGIQARARAWRRAECRRLLRREMAGPGAAGPGAAGPGAAADGGVKQEEGYIATAHHADDQLETWVLKLLRGAHLSHLQGMRPRSAAVYDDEDGVAARAGAAAAADVVFIKPLLGLPKARLVGFLEQQGLPWKEDASNQVDKYKRNRVRLRLLPLMADIAGGEAALRTRVAELAAQSAALDGWVAAEAAASWEGKGEGRGVRDGEMWVGDRGEDAEAWAALPRLVREEVVHRFVARATRGAVRALPYAQVGRILEQLARDAIVGSSGGNKALQWRLHLTDGWAMDRQGGVLRVSLVAEPERGARRRSAFVHGDGEEEDWDQGKEDEEGAVLLSLADPGLVLAGLPPGWRVAAAERVSMAQAEQARPPGGGGGDGDGSLILHGLPLGSRLRVRRRRDGDRFHPSWREGPVKLKDFLRGQRVPLHRRDEVLLLCVDGGKDAGDGDEIVAMVDPPHVARPWASMQREGGGQDQQPPPLVLRLERRREEDEDGDV